MKRLIPAGILLLFIIIVSVAGKKTIYRGCSSFSQSLEACKQALEKNDIKTAEKEANSAKKEWDRYKTAISLFANRRLTDEIEQGINHLEGYIEGKDISGAIHEYKTIKSILGKLKAEQRFSIESFC